jgi:predicted HTH transcriptional regulator
VFCQRTSLLWVCCTDEYDIVNAVTHPDFTSNASVQVMLFSDRLELRNSGGLPSAFTIPLLQRAPASISRYPLIAEPMFLAHYAEKAGSGILDMIALCHSGRGGGEMVESFALSSPA